MRSAAAAFTLLLAASACDKKDDSPSPPSAVTPAASSASLTPVATPVAPAGALTASPIDPGLAAWHLAIDPKGTSHIDMPGVKEHIQADTSVAQGTLDLVARDLAKSRGLVRIDLTTFATHTFGNDDDATQTKHARTWLEVVVDGTTNEKLRWAEFAIRSVDGLSANDLTTVAPKAAGGEDLRIISATLHGELRVHEHTVPKDAVVDVTFHYPTGAAADSKPVRVDIKSKQPIHVVLKDHDVHPRDPAGKALAWTTSLVAKVAEAADVTVDLGAVPAP